MPRRKRSKVPSPCCVESEMKDVPSGDAPCEPECPFSPSSLIFTGTEDTALDEDASFPEPAATDCLSRHRYFCNAICGKQQVLALAGPTAQTVSCATIRSIPKNKGAYATLHGLPTRGSPQQTFPCAHGCRTPLTISPCSNRRRLPLPLHITPCNTQSAALPDLCTTLCTPACDGQYCAQPLCPQSCALDDEPLVMTAYLPITIKLCHPTCSSNVPCTCASPCKSPTYSNNCKK